ncbi:5-formyltetrahydrofolate cyclo-ligase [Roseibium marinum]|uniref:5-formyltetrahydrofolate cyclo-ligase n=1 Tax=Roseibium marinum TaxID=281252 RepID=A0A2S3UM46_9HYPH|nr:5-formyltetrahydrofolate cyclo-ligase [Roseibium marinum]POF28774.1 5,10-methenyltetrahydrofolate synthetase [Roseibium marinum]
MSEEEDRPGDPVCYACKLVGGHIVDEQTFRDVSRFRKSERIRLMEKRRRMENAERREKTIALIANLHRFLENKAFARIAVYWPIRGEPDLRLLMTDLSGAGRTVLLPVVTTKEAPLQFLPWHTGCAMSRGIWNIPVPATGEAQVPDIILSPLVGVDDENFRLGNGGGYYDRTLAAFDRKPLTVGVGFEFCRMPTIFPLPWDIAMDVVVTEKG